MERHTPHRTHLVYQPGPDPRLFLWGDDPLPHPAIEHLASPGRRASARIVTDRLTIERVRGTAIELLAGATALAAKLGFDLVARERIVPLIQHSGMGMEARWGISLTLPEDADRFSHLAQAFPPAAHAVPRDHESRKRPVSLRASPMELLYPVVAATAALARELALGSPIPADGSSETSSLTGRHDLIGSRRSRRARSNRYGGIDRHGP